MSNNSSWLSPQLEKATLILVLGIVGFLTLTEFFLRPHPGFLFSSDGTVVLVFEPVESNQENTLQVGDQLTQIGLVPWETFKNNRHQTLFDGVQAGDSVAIQLLRNGEPKLIAWTYPGQTWEQFLEELNSEWWVPYIFLAAGTFALLVIRPKDTRWRLLVAFNYITAVWFAAGMSSLWHVGVSIEALRTAVWLSIPIYLHLHWVFPQPLRRLPGWLVLGGYLFAVVMALLDLLQLLPGSLYQMGLLVALIGSVLLTLIRLRYPDQRPQIGFLALATLLCILPAVIAGIVSLLGPSTFQGGALLALPALPGAYIYTAYRQQLGNLGAKVDRLIRLYIIGIFIAAVSLPFVFLFLSSFTVADSSFAIGAPLIILLVTIALLGVFPFFSLAALANTYSEKFNVGNVELRANRLLAPFAFFLVFGGIIGFLVLVADVWLNFHGEAVVIGVIAAFSAGLVTAVFYTPFQHFVEHRLLGIPIIPKQILEEYSTRIVSSLTKTNLIHLLQDQILPALLIRQSALLYFHKEYRDSHIIYSSGVDETQLPTSLEITTLFSQAGTYRPPASSSESSTLYPWARLILPLTLDEKPIGLWLLGRRDPDDLYAINEIPTLQLLANQTSIALVNIMQAENLLALYQSNIDRHEIERHNLAHELHDETLNQLAVLSSYMDEQHTSSQFYETYQSITAHIRDIITGLRPTMLTYGLYTALEELVEHLSTRTKNQVDIRLEVTTAQNPNLPNVNLYLYRIVQQASENTLRHSKATLLCISGIIKPNQVQLAIEDNGVGFMAGENLNLATLLSHKHYGLAGMFERAQLIGAELQINSAPGQGTKIVVSWGENHS